MSTLFPELSGSSRHSHTMPSPMAAAPAPVVALSTDPTMAARQSRAAQLSAAKLAKLQQETTAAIGSLPAAMADAQRLAALKGSSHPETLDALKLVSELGLIIGRRARISSGLPRGG